MQLISNWLNGKQEYWTGVFLYKKYGTNAAFKHLLSKEKTNFNHTKLKQELTKLCPNAIKLIAAITNVSAVILPPKNFIDTPLYIACKKEADNFYKKVMNDRAVLFSMVNTDGFQDVNRPDLVEQRSKLAVQVVVDYQTVSKLYDRADYVAKNGKLPNDLVEDDEDKLIDALPDSLVKQKLDNARKNLNKIKKRELTPERIALIDKNNLILKKLEARWQLLKPTM